ncbi:MAG: methylase, partial [Clostridia bacterium]|nr:methylase [Clostridia bacterium]
MTKKATEMEKAAKDFAEYWKGKGYEKGESQRYWLGLLGQVFGIEDPSRFVVFEEQVKLDHTSFIDVMIPSTHVMIEQKSIDKDLLKPIKQSDGSQLNPFQQAKRYSSELPYSQRPRWIVTCNFKEFLVYDMENPNGEPERILLEDLPKEYHRLSFLVDTGDENIKRE